MVEKWWNKYNEYIPSWNNIPSLKTILAYPCGQITNLLNFVLRSTHFQYKGSIYKQTEDTGSGNAICRQHLPFTSPWRQKAPAKSPSLTPQLQENLMDTKQPAHTRSHTDQYLPYDSHHLQSVKPNIVKCLYECAKHLVTKPSTISQEKKHLLSVLISIGYPSSFMQS